MATYTLECGHTFELEVLVLRAVKCSSYQTCKTCKSPVSAREEFYLEFADVENVTIEKFYKQIEEQNAKLQAQPVRELAKRCAGITLVGKPCRNSAKKGSTCCTRHTL